MIRIKQLFSITCLAAFIFGCSQPSSNQTKETTRYWNISDPVTEGVNPLVLDSIHQDIETGKYGLIDHFLVIRNGKLVYEQAYKQDYHIISKQYDTTNFQFNYDHPDWHPFYNSTSVHTLQSVTKSVTSLLVGIAMDEEMMIPLDSPVMPLFSEYTFDQSDVRKQSITLRNLLAMQGGFEWDEASYDEADNDCIVMELSDDWIQYVLDKPMATTPGTQFVYNSGISVLLGKILRITTGKRIDQWAEEKLFGPLGITDYYWKRTPKGEIDTEGGLYLSTHDLAKVGYLMLDQGVWENQQIVSKEWVEQSIYPTVKFNERSGYGFQWWVPAYNDSQTEIFAGNGYGGQFLMIVPNKNLLVVFNGWNIHDQPEKSSWTVLQDRILPNLED